MLTILFHLSTLSSSLPFPSPHPRGSSFLLFDAILIPQTASNSPHQLILFPTIPQYSSSHSCFPKVNSHHSSLFFIILLYFPSFLTSPPLHSLVFPVISHQSLLSPVFPHPFLPFSIISHHFLLFPVISHHFLVFPFFSPHYLLFPVITYHS